MTGAGPGLLAVRAGLLTRDDLQNPLNAPRPAALVSGHLHPPVELLDGGRDVPCLVCKARVCLRRTWLRHQTQLASALHLSIG